jgi:hypothetical protein
MPDDVRPSILPLSARPVDDGPPRRPPTALEQLLGLAAADPRFAEALITDRERAAAAAGIAISAAERASLLAPGPAALRRAIAGIAPLLGEPDRRAFLRLASAALVALAAGAVATPAVAAPGPRAEVPRRNDAPTGIRPDRPPRDGTRLALDIVSVKVLRGKLTEAGIRSGIRRALHLVERCANDARSTGKRIGPQVVLGLTVSPEGKTTRLLVRGDGDAKTLEPCLQPRMPQFRFPAVPGPDPTLFSVTLSVTERSYR